MPQEDKRRRSDSAYDTLCSNFKTLVSFVQLDTVAHPLIESKIINPDELQRFRAAPTPVHQVEGLLIAVMKRVQSWPECFGTFCNALEASVPQAVVKELRGA